MANQYQQLHLPYASGQPLFVIGHFTLFIVGEDRAAYNMGFANIGAGSCYLLHQQYGSSSSGRTNIAEHFLLSSTKVFQSAAVTG